jgi:membrane-bound serine protease (ClpP class)
MSSAKKLRLIVYLIVILASLAIPFISVRAQQEQGVRHVDLLNATGEVTPAMQSYISRGIREAETDGAVALIIRLDTPGGSIDITQEIIQAITAARVPTVVYVAPSGAHAASAGTFITLAADIAAMAPGTSIGAASPVGPSGETLTGTIASKVQNILVADIEGLTRRRGEKAMQWATQAITEARAANEQQAQELGIIDYVAPDLPTLLKHMDGKQVEVMGANMVLHTADAQVNEIPMTFFEDFLHVITNPNIAFILMTIGINGLLFELASPGGYVPGIVGAICLLLALYAFGTLPVNYAGFLFIALAFVLFVLDVKAPTHGILTVAGVASFVFGSLVLFNSPLYAISRPLIAAVALGTGGFFAFAIAKVVLTQRRPAVTGYEGLIGQWAEARTDLAPEGMVFLKGELWSAITHGATVKKGERVRVVGKQGFLLMVEHRHEEGDKA